MELERVEIEMDAKIVGGTVKGRPRDNSILGDTIIYFWNEMRVYPHCEAEWVNRDYNLMKHCLAMITGNS